jgi:hypothetical protein
MLFLCGVGLIIGCKIPEILGLAFTNSTWQRVVVNAAYKHSVSQYVWLILLVLDIQQLVCKRRKVFPDKFLK